MTRDIAASVRGRLQNRAKQSGRPLQELLQYFAMERFLYRLSKSEYGSRFVLKGALMFRVWNAAQSARSGRVPSIKRCIPIATIDRRASRSDWTLPKPKSQAL
ncbi:MAG TPA: hypothetical protein DDZ51_12895 [Planctomycetaceae bacterium]|nr:hypothetical protein [Planctomycetaceae bacterium]